MDYRKFVKEVKEGVSKLAGDDTDVYIKEIKKNNAVSFKGIILKEKDRSVVPVVYLETFYQNYLSGTGMKDIIEAVYNACLDSSIKENPDIFMFGDYEKIKGRIMFKLVNYKMNEKLLEEIPYEKYLDLAVVFYVGIPIDGESVMGTLLIKNEHLKMWGVTQEEAAREAYANTPRIQKYQFRDMAGVLGEYIPDMETSFMEEAADTDFEMILFGNQSGMFGAACLLYPEALRELAEEKKSNLVILPSSVHELILLPVSEDMEQIDFSSYAEMIQGVNDTLLRKEEILSDHAYFYDRKTDKVYAP